MLNIMQKTPENPKRVVIIGGKGFVGGTLVKFLAEKDVATKTVTRADTDLCCAASVDYLARTINDGDVVVNAAAIAPCKDLDQLVANIAIIKHIQAGLEGKKLTHLINVSSDAVFGDMENPITERSPLAPGSIHGVMHLMREITINLRTDIPVTHIRPTLIYGSDDPHNGYGPNRFARQALAGEIIPLFGKGEERRDHIFIGDLAEILWRVITYRATGDINAATGETHSFHDLAELAIAQTRSPSRITCLPRSGPMPHKGYRPFDVSSIRCAFPDFRFTPIEDGIRQLVEGLRSKTQC